MAWVMRGRVGCKEGSVASVLAWGGRCMLSFRAGVIV